MKRKIKILQVILLVMVIVLYAFSGVNIPNQGSKKSEEVVSTSVSYSSKTASASGGLYYTSGSDMEMERSGLVNSSNLGSLSASNDTNNRPSGYAFNVYCTENLAGFSTNGLVITNGGKVNMKLRWEELPGRWVLLGGSLSVSGNYNTGITSPFYSVEITISDTSGFNWSVPNSGEAGSFSGLNSFSDYYTTVTVELIEKFGPWELPDGQYEFEVGWAKWSFTVDMEP
jgi:hypothetical protein